MSGNWQLFKCGSEERKLDFNSSSTTNELQFIYVDDVLEDFKIASAERFEANGRTIPYMRDDHGNMYQPKRIPCRPGCTIQVVCSTTRSGSTFLESPATPFTGPGSLRESANQLTIQEKANPFKHDNSILARRTTTQLKSLKSAIVQANNSGVALDTKAMQELVGQHLIPSNNSDNTLQYLTQNVDILVKDMGELKQQGSLLEQFARKMIEMQQQTLDRLTLIQTKTEAILTQQLELAEYPIPRLFIVLPEEPTEYDPRNWFRTKFRLYFICECGTHTETVNSKGQHHLHLAKHEGYVVREPTKFFKKYGPFLLLMLEMIKLGTNVAGHVVPTLASLKVVELTEGVKQTVESVTAKINYSLECIDKQFATVQGSSMEGIEGDDHPVAMTQQDLNNYLNNIEGLEGVELRQLGSFLKTSSEQNLLGNLYRMTTTEGHVKWVCLDHFRSAYLEKNVQKLRELVQLSGKFDEQNGKITIGLSSSFVAAEFYRALGKAKGVLELDIALGWDCTKNDLRDLKDALNGSRVSILALSLPKYRNGLNGILSSTSSQVGTLLRFQELRNMKSVHVVLPLELANLLSVQPKSLSRLCKFTFSLTTAAIGVKEFEILVRAVNTNHSYLTMFNLARASIGDVGAEILSDAIKTNSTLTIMNLSGNSITDIGARALSVGLLKNSTLTTLVLDNNSIGNPGTQSLSIVLTKNSTLAALYLESNPITEDGARALFKALKTNSSLTVLSLAECSITKPNNLGLVHSSELNPAFGGGMSVSIDSEGQVSYMYDEGYFVKNNPTLPTWDSSVTCLGEETCLALFESLSENSTLTTLDLFDNSIGNSGAEAVFKALKTNSTLTTLNLRYNSIDDNAVQGISEALKMNSTLMDLNLRRNQIKNDGAQVIFEGLQANSTLATLNLELNSFGRMEFQSYLDTQKPNSIMATLIV